MDKSFNLLLCQSCFLFLMLIWHTGSCTVCWRSSLNFPQRFSVLFNKFFILGIQVWTFSDVSAASTEIINHSRSRNSQQGELLFLSLTYLATLLLSVVFTLSGSWKWTHRASVFICWNFILHCQWNIMWWFGPVFSRCCHINGTQFAHSSTYLSLI